PYSSEENSRFRMYSSSHQAQSSTGRKAPPADLRLPRRWEFWLPEPPKKYSHKCRKRVLPPAACFPEYRTSLKSPHPSISDEYQKALFGKHSYSLSHE